MGRLKTRTATAPDACEALARFDNDWRRRLGVRRVGGLDEAGRGALAGPVVAACVVLAPGARLAGVNDSKQLDPDQREALVPRVLDQAASWGLGWASAAEVDRRNVLQATHLAAYRALAMLDQPPELLLTDYLKLSDPPCPIEPLTKGDARSRTIAAASILAKVARDRIMVALDREYPLYGFAAHKGYGTPIHWAALDAHGPSTLHRLTYRGVCFFSAEPSVRSRTRPPRLADHLGPPTPDWREVLGSAPGSLDAGLLLPEAEWVHAREGR